MITLGLETILASGVSDSVLDTIVTGVRVRSMYFDGFMFTAGILQVSSFLGLDMVCSFVSKSSWIL